MKHRLISLAFAIFLFPALFYAQKTLIYNVHVIPMTGSEEVWKNRDVWIEGEEIIEVTQRDQKAPSEDDFIIDGTGQYLMPGLSEMHAHIPTPGEDGDDTYVREVMMLYLANGITTIRGMLGQPYHLELKKIVVSGDILAPRIYTSSPSMNGGSIPTKSEAETKVKAAARDGYDFLKIHPGIQSEVMEHLVKIAREEGIRFAGHVPAQVGIHDALAYGYWSVDHADGYIQGLVRDDYDFDIENTGFFGLTLAGELDWEKINELASQTIENDVWLVPTQSLFTRWASPISAEIFMNQPEMDYMPSSTRYAWTRSKTQMINDPGYSEEAFQVFLDARNKILKSLHEAGVQFLLGSDSPQVMNVPGFSIFHEIESLVEAGIPVAAIIASGTRNVAEFFGEAGSYGVIAPGAKADLVLRSGNPMEDYNFLKENGGVFVRGKWLSPEFLAGELAIIRDRHTE